MFRTLCLLSLLLPSEVAAQRRSAPVSGQALAVAINREVVRIAGSLSLWPGYHPTSVPLAIFTGDRTYLFRHPAPPPEFTTADGVTSMPGRHPAVTANSSNLIGGVATATVLADRPGGAPSVGDYATVALHEAFHVFQRATHAGWQGNEGDLFTYPVERADVLRLRREESEYLRRALGATGGTRSCLTRHAMARRHERFAMLTPAHAAYERNSEMNEGLATYVELRAAGKRRVEIPASEYPATAVRQRFYAVGPALAFLLDGTRPDWREALERQDGLRLDELLTRAVAGASEHCLLPGAVSAAIAQRAEQDAAAVAAERVAARRRFDERAGTRLVIEVAPGAPLWPQGFDPLNVEQVAGGTLHHRMLKLGNDSLTVSMVDGEGADFEAFTEAAGDHPLFNGIRRVEIVLPGPPSITREGRVVTINAPGLQGRFAGAVVTEEPNRLVVRPRL
ncbi:MAG: hypothetical protein V9E87_16125 [Gemmatimonadales bacterium]